MGILRTRMEQDLLVRGRSAKTRDGYLRVVADLAKHYHRSPDQLTDREVQQYLVHLIQERTLAWSSCRVAASALRFFCETTLGRARAARVVRDVANNRNRSPIVPIVRYVPQSSSPSCAASHPIQIGLRLCKPSATKAR